MSIEDEEETIEEREREWYIIDEPPHGRLKGRQEEAIRSFASGIGFENLRGFHMFMRSIGWDYYDVLQEVSP